MDRRNFLQWAGAASAMALTSSPVFADWSPRRPINIILPYKAGGGTDSFARAMASVSGDLVPVPLVIVNKPGSSGITGATEAAAARPDGNTVMLTSAGSFLLTSMLRGTDVNPFDSFEIIGQIGNLTTSLFVPANSPYGSAADFVAAARANPGKLRWAHTGRGGIHHVAGQGFLAANGIEAVDVPFKGGAGVRAAIIGEQVDFAFTGIQQAAGFEDQLRVLGLNAMTRDAIKADIPTLPEQGFEIAEVSSPIVLFAPKGVEPDILSGMEKMLQEIAQLPAFAEIMAERGNTPAFLPGAEAKARLMKMQEDAAPIIASLKSSN